MSQKHLESTITRYAVVVAVSLLMGVGKGGRAVIKTGKLQCCNSCLMCVVLVMQRFFWSGKDRKMSIRLSQTAIKLRFGLGLSLNCWLIYCQEGVSRSISSMHQFTRLIYCNLKTIIVAMVVSSVVICFSVGESSVTNDRDWSRDFHSLKNCVDHRRKSCMQTVENEPSLLPFLLSQGIQNYLSEKNKPPSRMTSKLNYSVAKFYGS